MNRPPILCVAAVLALASVSGCAKSTDMETAVVRGTVTLDGKPYGDGGTVLFQPEGAGKMATGSIQSDGSYEMTTYSAGDGAIVGRHKVSVQPIIPQVSDEQAAEPDFKSSIPVRYGSSSQSGLVCDVKPGEVNEFPIHMTSP